MSKIQTFTAGFVFGFLTAGLTVLLSTPKSGQQIRNELNETTKRWIKAGTQLKKDSLELKNNVVQLAESGKETLKDVTHELKNAFNDWKDDIDPNLKRLQKDIEQLKEKVEKQAAKSHADHS